MLEETVAGDGSSNRPGDRATDGATNGATNGSTSEGAELLVRGPDGLCRILRQARPDRGAFRRRLVPHR